MNLNNLKQTCRLTDEDILIGPPDVSTEYHTKFCKHQKAYKNKHMNYGEALAAENKWKRKLCRLQQVRRAGHKEHRGGRQL